MPVAQQLVQRDMFATLWPVPVATDLGRMLESHWRTLSETVAELANGKKEGWRPSVLLNPTLVEAGQQPTITNVSLAQLESQLMAEVDKLFEIIGAWHETFRLATAVRMNTSSSYVSLAVSLPTELARRVTDARYFDNYGV